MEKVEEKQLRINPQVAKNGNGLVLNVEQIDNYFIAPGKTASIRNFKEFVSGFDSLDDNHLEERRQDIKRVDQGYRSFPFIHLIERIQSIRKREPHEKLISDINKYLSNQSEPVSVSSVLNHLNWYCDWRRLGTHGAFQATLKELGYQLIQLTLKSGKQSSTTYVEPPVIIFNRMLDKCEDWQGAHLDDGESAECSFKSAHNKVKNEFGDKLYEDFCDWLDEDNPGPHG